MGKGRDSLHPREGEIGSSLPKQLVTQTDTSSLSPAVVQVLSRPKPRWSRQLGVPDYTPLYTEQLETSELQLRPSSGEKQQYRRQCYFYICDSAEL